MPKPESVDRPPGTKVAEQMFTRSQGATMGEIIAATGGPQYNVLKRLEAQGYAVDKVKEGRETRYFARSPALRAFEATISGNGQITLPKGVRERLGVHAGDKLRFTVDSDDHVVVTPAEQSVRRLSGVLSGSPRRLSIEDMDEAIGRAVAEKDRRASK